jgi:hypothetical protein
VTEAEQSPARFGPDATLCSVADWLTAHVASIDEFFSEMRYTYLHVTDVPALQKPSTGSEEIGPRARIAFESSDRLGQNFSPKSERSTKKLRPVEAAWQERFELLRRRCILREDAPHQEAIKLSIWQGGMAFGMVRQPNDDGALFAFPGRATAEQCFVWMRQDDRYVGRRLEIRLHGASASWFGQNATVLRPVQAAPTDLLTNPDILQERERAFACLFQMQRQPTRVDIGRKMILAIYEGENDAARAALDRAES